MSEGKFNIVNDLSPQYFWDTDVKKLDANHSRRLIIERVFSLGTVEEISRVIDYYGEPVVVEVLTSLNYLDPNIKPPLKSQGLTIFSEEDILAMKLNAISVSGQRSKDFIDIYFALDHFSIREILRFYQEKYQQHNSTHILKSLVFFDDVDLSDWPILLKQPELKWSAVKNRIEKAVLDFIKTEKSGGRK